MKHFLQIFKSSLIVLVLLSAFGVSAYGAAKQMEYLDRGVVAVKVDKGVFVSWRFLGTDSKSDAFNVYRDGVKLNSSPITNSSNYSDAGGNASSVYTVKKVSNGKEVETSKPAAVWGSNRKTIKLNRPGNIYVPNDMSVGDVDGDGEYELFLKWDPNNAKDNSQSGVTGNVYIDCYKLSGKFLWRIDLGQNIRAGAHYTQFQVYDYDGDGKCELVCKTAPGTKDGKGQYVLMGNDDPSKDYRNSGGYILSGPEYLTIFNCETGAQIHTVAYNPPRGNVRGWGDNYGNRVDRFLACTAFLDGQHPSVVMCRGYYTRSTLAAYDYKNGKLVQRWFHDSPNGGQGAYGEGNHNLSVADVDGDGFDEIIYGSACIDHDGKLLYRTGFGHGDAMHVSDLDPNRPGLEGWFVHEDKGSAYGYEMRDLKTGTVIWGKKTGSDNGRGLSADIDSKYPGFECWSSAGSEVFDCTGKVISNKKPSVNFRVYWDGDLQDELLDGNKIDKWNGNGTSRLATLTGDACNGTKNTPNLSADIIGDWREEVILHNGSDEIYIYTTTIPTNYRLFTLMHDPVYRMAICWQNTAYNQPPHLGFYIGGGVDKISQPNIYVPGNGAYVSRDPELIKQDAGSSSQSVEPGTAIAKFNYQWNNAETVKVTWEPEAPAGIVVDVNTAESKVYFSGTPTVTGTYRFTVETVSSAQTQAVKGGTITVGDGKFPDPSIGRWGSGGARNQTVVVGNAIKTVVFNYSYADSIGVVGTLPEGVSSVIDLQAKQLKIQGTPFEVGVFEYSLKSYGGNKEISAPGGSITVLEDTTLSKLISEGDLYQLIDEGSAIEAVTFSWGAGTKDIEVLGLPEGLTLSKDGKTASVTGSPATSGKFTVKSVGNGDEIVYNVEIEVIPSSMKKVAYVTDKSVFSYANDTKILPALKADEKMYVVEVDAQMSDFDFSSYDLVVISEVAPSNAPLMNKIEGIDKPVLNMKVHVYKSTDATWSWATNGYGDNYEATSVTVAEGMTSHPIFKGVELGDDNTVQMVSAVENKALTYMNPESLLGVEGGEVKSLASITGASQVSILEIPAGTKVAGNTLANNFVQIGMNGSSYANVTADGVKVIKNACYYLLGISDEEEDATGASVVLSQKFNSVCVAPSVADAETVVICYTDVDASASVVLVDAAGVAVKTINFIKAVAGVNQWRINVSDLAAGYYAVLVKVGDKDYFRSLIVK